MSEEYKEGSEEWCVHSLRKNAFNHFYESGNRKWARSGHSKEVY